jgi:uncharacterized protein YdbL (DUF1318 family)
MTRAWGIIIVAGAMWAAGVLPLAGAGFAASAETAGAQDDMRDLKQRFEARYRQVVKAKSEGKVGETFEGYLAPLAEKILDDDADLAALVEVENNDREKLYELLARDVKDEVDEPAREKVTPEIVAERNAKRNFRNAKDSEFLRMQDGVWVQKKDERSYEEVLKLKEEGALSEREDGSLALNEGDEGAHRIVENENDRRRQMYEEIARTAESTEDKIAREHAEEHRERAGSRD